MNLFPTIEQYKYEVKNWGRYARALVYIGETYWEMGGSESEVYYEKYGFFK